uniref:Uncharacterized protein n=1 Tax=Aegilops tauschii TaxID=37682 RepID=M8AQ52_AEGTA
MPSLVKQETCQAIAAITTEVSAGIQPQRSDDLSFALVFVFQKSILFSTATTSSHHDEGGDDKEKISVTFVNKDGTEKTISVPVGMSMLEAAHENDIELEGACEGSLACSTCHVIVMDVKDYNKLEDPTDEENDMLDLAFGLTETSRLGCQVIAKPELRQEAAYEVISVYGLYCTVKLD